MTSARMLAAASAVYLAERETDRTNSGGGQDAAASLRVTMAQQT